MKRALALATTVAAVLGASTALAGGNSAGDDENDYEGRVEKSDDTYFGFDINEDKTKVTSVAAYLTYKCDNYPNGSGLFEADEDSLPVESGKFSGVLKQRYRPSARRQGPSGPPRYVDVIYDVSGKLGRRGTAEGDIEAKLKFKLDDGQTAVCKAIDDGAWNAKKGRDIDAPVFMPREP